MKNILSIISLSLLSLAAYAGLPPDPIAPPVTVPEPSSIALFGAAALALVFAKKFKK